MSTTAYCLGQEIPQKQKYLWYFHSLMPDMKVCDKVRFENFIRMTWDDFEDL